MCCREMRKRRHDLDRNAFGLGPNLEFDAYGLGSNFCTMHITRNHNGYNSIYTNNSNLNFVVNSKKSWL